MFRRIARSLFNNLANKGYYYRMKDKPKLSEFYYKIAEIVHRLALRPTRKTKEKKQ